MREIAQWKFLRLFKLFTPSPRYIHQRKQVSKSIQAAKELPLSRSAAEIANLAAVLCSSGIGTAQWPANS